MPKSQINANVSSGHIKVALAGATGLLGIVVSRVFLSPEYKSQFARVLCFTRNKTSQNAKELESLGAEVVETPNLSGADAVARFTELLEGIDVVVNLLNADAHDAKEALLTALINAGVKVYFPTEYGIDHRFVTFGKAEHAIFIDKKRHVARAHELSHNKLKVISLYMGLFSETSLTAEFGLDNVNKIFTVVGSPNTRTSYTSEVDIGRALARLSILSLSPSASTVPDFVRISGDSKSYDELKRLVEQECGKEVELKTIDLGEYKANIKADHNGLEDFFAQLRVAMGEGIVNFSNDNDNELVNPKETFWNWKTMAGYIKETNGGGSFTFF